MSYVCFVTGTDTEIGKTFSSCALLQRAAALGQRAVGMKPVAAGTDEHGINEDVAQLRAASNVALPPEVVNPYCFAPPIAPHIAAREAGVEIDFDVIAATVATARQAADFVVVEGAGGFLVPFGVDRDSADLARHLALPVVLVVGMRLGCINHALLTVDAILSRNLPLAGWIANSVAPDMARFADNLDTLRQRIGAPCLGVLPHAANGGPAAVAGHLTLPR